MNRELFTTQSQSETVHPGLMSLNETLWTLTETANKQADEIKLLKRGIKYLYEKMNAEQPTQSTTDSVETSKPVATEPGPRETPNTEVVRMRVEGIKAMLDNGMKYKEIARALGVSINTVKTYIYRYVRVRSVDELNNTVPAPKLKANERMIEIRNTDGDVKRVVVKREPRNAMEARMLEMYSNGVAFKDIAKVLNLTHGQITGRLYKMVEPGRGVDKRFKKKR